MTTISIRRTTVADAGAMARIMGDLSVLPDLLQMPYASEEGWANRLRDSLLPGKTDLMLVAERGGEVVGSAGLHPVGPQQRRRHALMLGISVARDAQGSGVGTALMQAMCDYADDWIGALRIELTVFADNERAQALYRKFGFVQEGLFRNYAMRNGHYADTIAMARFHPSPPSIGAAPPVSRQD